MLAGIVSFVHVNQDLTFFDCEKTNYTKIGTRIDTPRIMCARSYHELGLEVLESLLVLVHVAARFLRDKRNGD